MSNETISQIAHDIAVNPKTALGVGSATAGSGVAAIADAISTGLGLVAVTAGIILTLILIRKHLYEFKQMKQRDLEQSGCRATDQEE